MAFASKRGTMVAGFGQPLDLDATGTNVGGLFDHADGNQQRER
jgi:hypothetical protein